VLPLWAWWVVALSAIAWVACVVDKSRAQRRGGRIPERVLLGLALAGGSPGLVLGMLTARHKTRKVAFLAPLALVLLVQGAVAWWLTRGT
jgi:uncharacterized membrane protein YsdA (DUF1294 family)